MSAQESDKTDIKLANNAPGSVLFLCAMNSIRSPMAEYLTKALLGNNVYVKSAGVREGEQNGFAIAAMDDRGIDMSHYQPTLIDDVGDDFFDLIVTLSPEAHHAAMDMTRTDAVEVEYWPTEDPSTVAGTRSMILQAFIRVRENLEANIKRRFCI